MDSISPQYDYIVAGGGTAGVVVAARLSEDPAVHVLLIEAGADRSQDPLVLTPGLAIALYGKPEYDWNFESVPQSMLNGRVIKQARGKMLGGSSALNFMMTVYPSRGLLDAWGAPLGNDGWSYDTLAPYFRKFGTTEPPPPVTETVCRTAAQYDPAITAIETGPLQLSYGEGHSVNNTAWFDAFSALGLGATADPRTGAAIGAFQQTASIDPKTKTRSFSATAYLTEAVRARPNLVIWTESVVERVLFDTNGPGEVVATGVRVRTAAGKTQDVLVNKAGEVVLAAGALHTPQLLELSGIGGAARLAQLGVPVVVDNPNVGENAQDHPIVCQSFEVAPGTASGDVLRDPAVLQAVVQLYQQNAGAGPMGQSIISCAYAPLIDADGVLDDPAKAALFQTYPTATTTPVLDATRTLMTASAPPQPAIQFLLFPTQVNITPRPADMAAIITPSRPENYITIMTVLNHPFSRGHVHATSSAIDDLPVWDPCYNAEPADLEILARGVRFVETLVHTPPFSALLQTDGARSPPLVADSLDNAREIVRQAQISVFHVSGSTAMLPRAAGGVVDNRLLVYGVRNLRVVDASIFPIEPVGNIQTTVYAVAERAADIIKEDRK